MARKGYTAEQAIGMLGAGHPARHRDEARKLYPGSSKVRVRSTPATLLGRQPKRAPLELCSHFRESKREGIRLLPCCE
jgi:hypothetical protein